MDEQQQSAQQAVPQGAKPAEKNTVMGVLAYIGILVLVPYFTTKDDAFVRFHMKQGFVLLAFEVLVWIIGMLMWQLMPLLSLVNLGLLVLSIVGIVNVVRGEQKELPLVGGLAVHVKI